MKFKIQGKINVVVMVCMLGLGVIHSVILTNVAKEISISKITSNLNADVNYLADLVDASYPGDYRTDGNTIYKGEYDLADNAILQSVKSKTNMDYAIFDNEKCISATLNISESGNNINLGDDYAEVVIDQEKYIIKYAPIIDKEGNAIGIFAAGEKEKPYKDTLYELLIKSFIISGIALIIAIIITSRLSKSISHPIHSVLFHLKKIQNKDFSHSVEPKLINRSDEVGDLAHGFAEMQSALTGLVNKFKELSTTINHHAGILNLEAKHMEDHSEEVVSISQNISAITTTQANNLIDINDVINDLAKHIEVSKQALLEINKNAHEIGDISIQSSQQMNQVLSSGEEFGGYFQEFIDQISNFGNKVSKVNEIAVAIEEISKQTNLLALNASIEAARAGEAGKGFSVVAEQIRNLAEQSQNSSKNITALVNDLTFSSEQLKGNTTEINRNLSLQGENVYNNIVANKKINTAIENIVPKIQEVTENAKEASEHAVEIMGKIGNISALAQNISASCEEVSADSEESNTIIEEVHHSADELNQITQELESSLQSFIVE